MFYCQNFAVYDFFIIFAKPVVISMSKAYYIQFRQYLPMQENIRSSYLINISLRNFIFATMLTGIIGQICSFTDAIMVSNIVDSDGMSAMNIVQPISSLMYAIVMAMTSGAGLLAAKEFGRQNGTQAHKLFYVALFSTSFVVVAISLCIFFYCPELIGILCSDSKLASLATEYLRVYLLVYPIQVLSSVLFRYIKVNGAPQIVTRVALLSGLLNVVLDAVFICVFDMGIAGSAWGTVLSFLISDLFLIPFLKRNNSFSMRYCPRMREVTPMLRDNVSVGIPKALMHVMMSAMVLVVNDIILAVDGSAGLFVWSVIFRLNVLSTTLLSDFVEVNNTIGGVMIGEGDYSGVRVLSKLSFRYLLTGVFLFSLIVWGFAPQLLYWFGLEDTTQIDSSVWSLRIGVVAVIAQLLILFFSGIFVQQQRIRQANICTILSYLAYTCGVMIMSVMAPDYIWWGFSLLTFPLLFALLAYIHIEHRRNPLLDSFALQPMISDYISANFTVSYDNNSVQRAHEGIMLLLDTCEVSSKLKFRIEVCSEELLDNQLKYGSQNKNPNSSFDVRILELDNSIVMQLKDAGRPFNPTLIAKSPILDSNEEPVALGLHLVNSLASKVNYKYMFGLNVTTLHFDKV